MVEGGLLLAFSHKTLVNSSPRNKPATGRNVPHIASNPIFAAFASGPSAARH
jgi:hypothetical protein